MTIYLSLPMIFSEKNIVFNKILIDYIQFKPEVRKFNFVIESNYGTFPYTSWNGDINSNYGAPCLEKGIYNITVHHPRLVRLDFSNILLKNTDFYDVHGNVILKNAENGSNQIEISNLEFMDYIKNNYPQYQFIFSKNSDLIHPLDINNINIISEHEDILMVSLPSYFNQKQDILKKINLKNKIELTIGNKCKCSEEKIKECRCLENYHQLSFDAYSLFNHCTIKNKYNNFNEIENEINELTKIGFSHFKIDAPVYNNIKQFNLYLINSLIKPEFHSEFFMELNRRIL